jgi:gliding motility-associated-like protein
MKEKLIYVILFTIFITGNIFAQQPEPPTILSITVESVQNNQEAVKLSFIPPENSNNITGYIIYRYVSDENHSPGFYTLPIDNPSNPTGIPISQYTYIDNTAHADLQSESYYMASYYGDKDNYGLPCAVNSTIFLHNIAFDTCSMTNKLSWNSYRGWNADAYYNIIDQNGNIIASGLRDTFYIHNITQGQTYEYHVKGINSQQQSFKSLSNKKSITIPEFKNPDKLLFYINKIEFNGSAVNAIANVDITADIKGYALAVSNNLSSNFTRIDIKNLETDNIMEFTHFESDQPKFYRIDAVGFCDDTILTTAIVQPIVLNVESSNEEGVALKWNKSFIESNEVYAVRVSVDGGNPRVIDNTTDISGNYNFTEIGGETSEIFYFTVAATETTNKKSISNTICVTRVPKLEIPNAFTPNSDGLNDYFGPFWEEGNPDNYIKNAKVVEFKMYIYNKYGNVIFSTNKSYMRWAGDIDGSYVSEGGYLYYVWFKTSQGKTYEESGGINVVYP